MKIAIAQLDPTIGDLASNAQQILQAAQQADQQGAQLLITTELALCGYPPRDLLMRPSFIEAMEQTLTHLAKELPADLIVLVGLATANPNARARGEKPLFNSTALVTGGAVQQLFHKQLLPTYDVFDEDRYFEPGSGVCQFWVDAAGRYLGRGDGENVGAQGLRPAGGRGDAGMGGHSEVGLPGLRIGVTICEDLWNDEEFWGGRSYPRNPIADLADQGVDLIVNLSASPYSVQKQRLREAMLGHSAARFQCPIIYANQVGANDDLIFDGTSMAFNRQGQVVGRLASFQKDLTLIEYHLTQRDLIPTTTHPLPATDEAEIWSALVLGVQDYARKCGFSKVVVGLSGGIDSALVVAIATAALGRENVLGVLMPSPYSSDHSIRDALALCRNLGIRSETLAIGDLMKTYDQTLETLFADTTFGVAEENIQSRIRGNLLMAISNKFGHLLLSTGNKSEMAVGYCTLYGDMNGGLAVIADVPKTRVYALCRWLNDTATTPQLASPYPLQTFSAAGEIIPPNILSKAPSAELKPGQTDQDSLPPYDILDDILERLIQKHQSLSEIVEAGHDPKIVEKVVRLVSRAEFKRRQAPPVLKITDRAFGMGWRMPIAGHWSANLPIQQTQAV